MNNIKKYLLNPVLVLILAGVIMAGYKGVISYIKSAEEAEAIDSMETKSPSDFSNINLDLNSCPEIRIGQIIKGYPTEKHEFKVVNIYEGGLVHGKVFSFR
jgi:hypothetical protein